MAQDFRNVVARSQGTSASMMTFWFAPSNSTAIIYPYTTTTFPVIVTVEVKLTGPASTAFSIV